MKLLEDGSPHDLTALAGREVSLEEAKRSVIRGMELHFGVQLKTWRPGVELIEEGRRLAEAKYGADEWVKRR